MEFPLEAEYEVDGLKVILNDKIVKIREAQGVLDAQKLIKVQDSNSIQAYIHNTSQIMQVTESVVCFIYNKCKVDGEDAIYNG